MTVSEIGKLIRLERKRQGISQLELSQAADVGRRFIVELEGGKETSHLGKALKVMGVLGMTVNLSGAKGF